MDDSVCLEVGGMKTMEARRTKLYPPVGEKWIRENGQSPQDVSVESA